MPTVAPARVTFSAKTRLYYGVQGTADASLAHFGLLGQSAVMNLEQTFRQKMDQFPEVEVASAIQAQSGSMEAVLREWKRDALLMGFGLHASDITEAAGADTVVAASAGEPVTFDAAGIAVLSRPMKIGETLAVNAAAGGGGTASTNGTDYYLVPRDKEGRTLLVRVTGGNISAGATVYVAYTYNTPAYESFPIGRIGQSRYWSLRLEEDFTNGGRMVIYIPRARIGLRGGLNLNAPEGADMPVTIQALFDTTADALMTIRNYVTAPA
jgi:hypothetical protein